MISSSFFVYLQIGFSLPIAKASSQQLLICRDWEVTKYR